jgi:hypothetical protein
MGNQWLWVASNCVLTPKFRASKSPTFHIQERCASLRPTNKQ